MDFRIFSYGHSCQTPSLKEGQTWPYLELVQLVSIGQIMAPKLRQLSCHDHSWHESLFWFYSVQSVHRCKDCTEYKNGNYHSVICLTFSGDMLERILILRFSLSYGVP